MEKEREGGRGREGWKEGKITLGRRVGPVMEGVVVYIYFFHLLLSIFHVICILAKAFSCVCVCWGWWGGGGVPYRRGVKGCGFPTVPP